MLLLMFPTLLLQQLLDLLLLLQLLMLHVLQLLCLLHGQELLPHGLWGVAPEAMQLLHAMNSCYQQQSALLMRVATALVPSPLDWAS